MPRGITVLVDMDDTIEDLLSAWVQCLNKRYGLSVNPSDITDWDITLSFPSLSKEEVWHPLYEDEFWETVKPKQDAAKYLLKLQELGFNVYLCTATNHYTVKSKFENIVKRHFPFISWDQIIITPRKQLIDADILIDDGVHNLIGGKYKKILMSAPHNLKYKAEAMGMQRVDNWEEAYKAITGIAFNLNHGRRKK